MPENLDLNLPDQQEDAGDLHLGADWFAGPTLWSTDWTTETVISQLRRGNINLSPRYQRRNAWDVARKSVFIESLILGLPIPQIILAEERGKKGSFIVIDGKQRLLAIRQFFADATDTEFKQLKLSGLTDRKDLNGLTYNILQNTENLRDDLNNFENQTIRTVVIRGWVDEKYLYSVFLRINTGSVQLSPQELRQALHPGKFADFIDDLSINSAALRRALKINEPDFRMRDAELVLRYYAYKNFAPVYSGELKDFLDDTMIEFNKKWQKSEGMLVDQAGEFEAALEITREIFGERDELRKWNGRTYETRINRAVFDIMIYYFSFHEVRDVAKSRGNEIKKAFEDLCEKDRQFVSSLETTTKSKEANRVRFRAWAMRLGDVVGIKISAPLE